MRISTMQQYQVSINRMQDSQSKIGELQRQISTGLKYDQPSDAPAVAAESIRLQRNLSALERYESNIDIATISLELETAMFTAMNHQYNQLRDLTASVDAGENDENLVVKAREIREIVAALAGGMNQRDAQGEYIFSGSKGYTQPYELGPTGRWEYQGDNGQREIQVGATHYVASSDSGQYLFESVPGELQYSHSGATNVTPADITHDTAEGKKEFETFLKDEVKGDLELRTYPTATAGQFTFELVDTEGTVHHTETPVTGPSQDINFKGAVIAVRPPALTELKFPVTSASRDGIADISVADNAEMDKFFEDYGDVTLELVAGAPGTYKMLSSKTSDYIFTRGSDEWAVPADGIIKEGGLELTVTTPVTNNSFELKPPGPNHTVTDISNVASIEVVDADKLGAEMATALGAGDVAFEVRITTGPNVAAIVSVGSGTAIASVSITGAGTLASPYVIDDSADTGLKFTLDDVVDGETFRIELDDGAGNQLVTATSRIEVDYERKNILNVALELAEKLEGGRATPEARAEIDALRAQTLEDITIAQDQLSKGATGVGARLSALSDTNTANGDIKMYTQATLSRIQDADLAEVASNFKLEQTLLQASQQTFATVSNMTLFDYIN